LLEEHYRPAPEWPEMLRMAITSQTFTPAAMDGLVARLGARNDAEVEEMYRLFPQGHFRRELLDEGVFYGLWANGRLCAIAGTHVVAEPHGIAVIGGVFTHPGERGKGYAGAVTSAVTADLLARGCRHVVLNVFATNAPAIAVYRRLGFQTAHHLWSGQAELRKVAMP
jgi:RimJ/RimL family protein N-acetyltransferase